VTPIVVVPHLKRFSFDFFSLFPALCPEPMANQKDFYPSSGYDNAVPFENGIET